MDGRTTRLSHNEEHRPLEKTSTSDHAIMKNDGQSTKTRGGPKLVSFALSAGLGKVIIDRKLESVAEGALEEKVRAVVDELEMRASMVGTSFHKPRSTVPGITDPLPRCRST